MKKLLALVLALVMSMSLVTISNADFKDADKIDYTEAVDVMNAVGVLIGDENGNFNPKENLTRAQAAKIISYLLLGNKTAEGLAGSGKFTDVAKTSWAAGFVDYCAAVGVVNGMGNGKFDPNGSLTTLQFAKMLLVALGYDAKIEGFVGTDWSINVSAKANQVGLLNGLDVGANATLTREQAAKMCLNTLKAPLVEYDTKGTTVTVGGDASVTVGASKAEFKTSTNKKAQTISNAVINGTTAYTVEFAEEYYSDLKLNANTTDDFGRPCVEWFWKADSIGVYSNSDDLVATYTKKVTATDIYEAVGKSVSNAVKSGDAKCWITLDGKYIEAELNKVFSKDDTYTVNGTGNGDYTEVYVDGDNNVTIVTIRTYLFQAASDYNTKKDSITLTAAGDTKIALDNIVIDGEDFDIKNFKADDYILVTASTNNGVKYTVQSIDAAEVVSGEVTGYKLNDNATIGGTEYKYSATTLKSGDTGASANPVKSTTYTVGQNARVVLDKYGYIIAVDEAVVASNYVYVSEFAQPSGLSKGKVVASAYFTDGTTADITVKEAYVGGAMTSNTATIKGSTGTENAGWYTYSKNSANEYSLYNVEAKYTEKNSKVYNSSDYSTAANADNRVMFNNKVKFMKGLGILANDSTIVIVDDGDSVSVFTGVKNLPDIELLASTATVKATYLAKGASDYASYVFVSTTGRVSVSGNEDSTMVYYIKYDGQYKTTDNKVYFTYKVLDENGQSQIVKFDAQSNGSGDIYKVYNKTRVNGDDEITSVSEVTEGGKYIAGTSNPNSTLTYTDGALTLNQSGTNKGYTLADNAKITLVTLKSANELNKDKAADYEAAVNLTGKALGDLLKDYAMTYRYAGKVTDTNGSVIEELFVTVTAATYTKTPAPVVTGTYGLSSDAITRTANTSTIVVNTKVQDKSSAAHPVDIAAENVVVTLNVQTWNSASGTWNAASVYTFDVGNVASGASINVSKSLAVPTTQDILVSGTVACNRGTFALAEVVLAGR